MKLCGTCKGSGEVDYYGIIDVCDECDGEGVANGSTYTVEKIQRRKHTDTEVEQKKVKFDKKNASRSV